MAEEIQQLEDLIEELENTREKDYLRRNDLLHQISQYSISELKYYNNSILDILKQCLSHSETAQLATQIYTDYLSVIDSRDLAQVEEDLRLFINNLGDSNMQTRKFSHMFLVNWVKKNNDLNSVIRAFLSSGFSSSNVVLKQKSINSFQGIIITEAKMIDWNSKDIFNVIADLLQIWQNEVCIPVQKAADHALVSLCKRDEMRIAVTKLDIQQMKIIKQIAEKHLILGLLPTEIENSSIILTQHKKDNAQSQLQQQQQNNQQQQQIQSQPINNNNMLNSLNQQSRQIHSQPQNKVVQSDSVFNDLLNQSSRNNNQLLQSRRINNDDISDEKDINKQSNKMFLNVINSAQKLNVNDNQSRDSKGYMIKSEGYILNTDQNLKVYFGLLNEKQFHDLKSQKDWRSKAQTVDELEKSIEEEDNLQGIEDELEQYLDIILYLTSDTNFKVQVTSMNIVYAIIGLKKCAQENIFRIISNAIIDKLGDSKIAIRQLAQKIILQHYDTFEYNGWIDVITQNLKSKSAQLKEETLNLLDLLIKEYIKNADPNDNGDQEDESNNSDDNNLITQNSRLAKQQKRNFNKKVKKLNFDWKKIIKDLAPLLDDPKDKIKSKCLDCFIQINNTLNDSDQFKDYIQSTLNQDQLIKVQRATGHISHANLLGQNKLDRSGNLNHGVDYSNYQYIDQDGNMHFSFANMKKNEESNSYLPSSANPTSLNRSINRQLIQTSEIPRKSTEQNSNKVQHKDFKINPYNMIDSKGGRYSSNQQSSSMIEDASTSVGSSKQQTPNEFDSIKKTLPDSLKKNNINQPQKDSLDYFNDPYEKRQYLIGSAGKNQKSTFEVALEQQAILDKRVNSAVIPERNQYNISDNQKNNTISPSLKKTLKSSLNGGESSNYVSEEDLQPLRNADNAVSNVLNELKSSDWERQFQALDTVRRLIKYHHETLAKSLNFQNILKEINALIDNLRSSLAKNAMMTVSEMAFKLKKHFEGQIDGTFSKLMKKGLDANVFILEEVKKALVSICTNCAPQKILTNCFSLNMKSSQTKQYVLQCFDTLILVHQEKLCSLRDFDKIVENIGNLIIDSSQEVRNSAKSALYNLSVNCIDKNKIRSILSRSKDETTVNKIISAIDTASRGGLDSTLGATGRSTYSIYGKTSKSTITKSNNMNTGLFSHQSQSSNSNIDFMDTYNNLEQMNNISPENIRITKSVSQQQPPFLNIPKPAKSTSISRIQKSPGVMESIPNYIPSLQNNEQGSQKRNVSYRK